MTTPIRNVVDLALSQIRANGHASNDLRDFAIATKARADAAWDACSDARARGDELTGEFERGRADALCSVLGDQVQLSRQGLLTRRGPTSTTTERPVADLADILAGIPPHGGAERHIDFAQRLVDALDEYGWALTRSTPAP